MQGDFKLAEWVIQPSRNVIESRNRSVQIEPKTMDLLVCLAHHTGQVLSKERLIQIIWRKTIICGHSASIPAVPAPTFPIQGT